MFTLLGPLRVLRENRSVQPDVSQNKTSGDNGRARARAQSPSASLARWRGAFIAIFTRLDWNSVARGDWTREEWRRYCITRPSAVLCASNLDNLTQTESPLRRRVEKVTGYRIKTKPRGFPRLTPSPLVPLRAAFGFATDDSEELLVRREQPTVAGDIADGSSRERKRKEDRASRTLFPVRVNLTRFKLSARGGMQKDCRDCLGIRYRINSLDQTWKWLHQTIALHDYLISITASQTNVSKCFPQ